MARAQAAAKKQEKSGPVFVISRTDDGFQVYAPADPSQSYLVSGTTDQPHCTCPAFEFMEDSPDFRCEHVDVVFGTNEAKTTKSEPESEQPKTNAQVSEPEVSSSGKGATMLLKRSVSPDGRIDSLSVEISFPVGKGSGKDLKLKAMKTLKLQGEITQGFLAQNGRKETDSDHAHEDHRNGNGNRNGTPDGAEPAKMLEIGGLNTKWGRRLFISFQVNGDMLKLFGNRKRLEEVLTAVGQSKLAKRLEEGLKINAPCLVTTKESGQYTNIDEVFPYEKPTASRGRG